MLSIQQFSTGVLAEIIRRQPSSPARTNFAWQLAVGPALARATTVALQDGVLIVRSTDARWTREIGRARDVVLKRLQNILGPEIQALQIER
jgi:predicted nucleic acid-binding Zn ribbon protein